METWEQFLLDIWVGCIVSYGKQPQPQNCENTLVKLVLVANIAEVLFEHFKKLMAFNVIAF